MLLVGKHESKACSMSSDSRKMRARTLGDILVFSRHAVTREPTSPISVVSKCLGSVVSQSLPPAGRPCPLRMDGRLRALEKGDNAHSRTYARVAALTPQQRHELAKNLCEWLAKFEMVFQNGVCRHVAFALDQCCIGPKQGPLVLNRNANAISEALYSKCNADPLLLINRVAGLAPTSDIRITAHDKALVVPHGVAMSFIRNCAEGSILDNLNTLVQAYLLRAQPLPPWATAILTTPDVTQVVFGHLEDALTLSRASCVCRTWARDELSQPVWRRLVLHRWPDEPIMLAGWSVNTCMRRKYRSLSQGSVTDVGTQRQNERARSQIRAEYLFRCIMIDPATNTVLAEWASEFDVESGTPHEGAVELQPLHPIGGLMALNFCGMDEDDGAWLPRGGVTVRVFAKRLSDGCATQFAAFDVDLARDASDTQEWDAATQQHWLTGCTHSIRLPSLLQTSLGMPEDSQTQHSCVRVATLEGSREFDADHDLCAPSAWRLNDMSFSFHSGQGSCQAAVTDSLRSIGEESTWDSSGSSATRRLDMWCSEVLAILQMSEWV